MESPGLDVYYLHHRFVLEPSPGEPLAGRLVLDDAGRERLARLTAAEGEGWYLDADGERLQYEELFARSPWSGPGPNGPVKLLCRWLDLETGSVWFSTPETYPGDTFRWLRPGPAPPV